jgi:hypothetical protein
MNNPDHISEKKNFWGVKILKFFDADQGSGIEKIRIGINIPEIRNTACLLAKL